jgi:staphylococcal nuclease domain-containing protein 1
LACVNVDLLEEGLAIMDRKNCKYLSSYPQMAKRLQEAVSNAKVNRRGMFEYGDVEDDE